LEEAMRNVDPAYKARTEKELVHCVTESLTTRDTPLWRPYTVVRTSLPLAVDNLMPTWQEPKSVRCRAMEWLLGRAERGGSVPLGLSEQATPLLCDLALNDPHPEIRVLAKTTLGELGTFSSEGCQIMLGALNSSDHEAIHAGASWFARYPVDPERVVPLLLSNFECILDRRDCALALRAYGPRAKGAAEWLQTFAQTNDWWASPEVNWVLEAIDP